MLEIPEGGNLYRILSLDPGTSHTGVAVIDLDLKTKIATIVHVETINLSKLIKKYKEREELFGTRATKLFVLENKLTELVHYYQPNVVISESPYMGKFANAFEALVQCLSLFQRVLLGYDGWMVLETIDPSSVKKAVGVKKKGTNKNLVMDGVLNLKHLRNSTGINLSTLDEHSIDSIAVGCYKLNSLGIKI